MENNTKKRLVRSVAITEILRQKEPVTVVEDEHGTDRLKIGETVVGWPKPGHAYPDSIEIVRVVLSDGRVHLLAAESVPFVEKRFAEVIKVTRSDHTISIEKDSWGAVWLTMDDLDLGVPKLGFRYPPSVSTVEVEVWLPSRLSTRFEVAAVSIPYISIDPMRFRYCPEHGWQRNVGYGRYYRWTKVSFAEVVQADAVFLPDVVTPTWVLGGGEIDAELADGLQEGDLIASDQEDASFPPPTSAGPFTFEGTNDLQIGQVVETEYEYAFWRNDHGVVTNGKITFPPKRPFGAGWTYYQDIRFVQPIHERNWPRLLDGIVGCYFDGVNTAGLVRERMARQEALERNQERIRRIVDGQCFDPGTFDETQDIFVGIGEKLLFTGLKNGRHIYVVDSPEYGHALYVFDEENEDAARDWANQNIRWTEARNKAVARIIHTDGWKERLQEALD